MRVLVIGLLVLALSVAGISTYLIQNFSTPEAIGELEKQSRPIVNQVLVANMNLNPGAAINGDTVSWREWPKDSLNENYISVTDEEQKEEKFKSVVDSRVRRIINAGEPVLSAKLFKSDMPGFMAGVVEEGMRAMAISVSPLTGVAGFILPGDRVDILLVHDKAREALQEVNKNRAALAQAQAQGQEGMVPGIIEEPRRIEILRTATETILEDVLVLAVDQSTGPVEGQTIPAKTLLFELTPKQVQILTTAQTMGQLSVSLRNVGDIATDDELPGTVADETLSDSGEGVQIEVTVSGDDGDGGDQTFGDGTVPAYTTDVEVSSFIRKLTDEAARESQALIDSSATDQAARNEAAEQVVDEEMTAAQQKEIDALRRELEAVREGAQNGTPVPIAESPPEKEAETNTLEIYRGGASETEVIQIQ